MQMSRGKFITFEGGEGSGKSTQALKLQALLTSKGIPSVFSREPGGTPFAEAVRNFLLFGAARLGLGAEAITAGQAPLHDALSDDDPLAAQMAASGVRDRMGGSTKDRASRAASGVRMAGSSS